MECSVHDTQRENTAETFGCCCFEEGKVGLGKVLLLSFFLCSKAVHVDVRCEIKISLFICPRVSFYHLNVVIFGNKTFYAKQLLGGVCSF